MKLLLNGGGSTEKLLLTMNKLNEIIDHNKPILYVPLAMEEIEHPYDSCYDWFIKQIKNINIPHVDMPKSFKEFATLNLNDYSAIFIGGGNTFRLLKGLKDYKIFNKIKEYLKKDGIVIGCSAGSIIFGYDINSCLIMDDNNVNLKDTKGFNMLNNKSLFAHYTNEYTKEAHEEFKKFLKGYSLSNEPVIALPEEDTIYINNQQIELIGTKSYYEFIDGKEIEKTNIINSKNLYTKRLELKLPTMEEQQRLWEILCDETINQYYFPTPDRIFNKNNLKNNNLKDLKEARKIFLNQFQDWEKQKPFYQKKIEQINNQDDSQKYTWSIFLKDTDTVIGQITCQPKENEIENIRDIGWYIDPKYQGNGYATEAAETMLDFMFNEVGIKEIKTSAAEINPASWKIMEKLGFKYLGNKKSTYFCNDEILNLKEYCCNKEMFNKKRINNK